MQWVSITLQVQIVNGAEESLQLVLEHELRCAERYRRFVAVMRVASSLDDNRLASCLASSMRVSDDCVWLGNGFEVLMSETTERGALSAVRRYSAAVGGKADIWFGIAEFPGDGHNAKNLLDLARLRLEESVRDARARGRMSVIAE